MNKNLLEIVLITYNRKEYLEKTFSRIFDAASPVKDFDITVLDNASVDGTSEFIAQYRQKFPNLKHIRHKKNIGGNANIARAFEIAQKEYVWVLCDDDEYDFSRWHEVEEGLKESPDALVVSDYMEPQKNIARLLKQLTFVPSAIYKTSNITDAVMINANYNISNMFPHLAIACALINNKAKITFTKHPVVKMILTENTASSNIRGCADNHPHPQMKKMFWELGYLNSIKMIKDKKLRSAIMDDMQPQNGTFAQVVKRVVKEGLKDKQLFFDYLMGLDTKHFLKFILFLFIVFDKRKSGYYILLLGRISVKVWPAKK